MEKINERDKNDFLDTMLNEDEKYDFKIYGGIEASMKDISPYFLLGTLGSVGAGVGAAMGAFRNKFGYIGVTQKKINFVVVETFSPEKIKEKITLPIGEIVKIKHKRTFIPSQTLMIFEMKGESKEKIKVKFRVSDFVLKSDLKNQKEGVEAFKAFAKNFK